jgi:hypothetical protein
MNDVANEKPTPARPDVPARRGGFDWSHALVELATVVIGILIALAVNNWADARHNAGLEARYLQRLLADSTENLTILQERIDRLTRRTDELSRLSAWLTGGSELPRMRKFRKFFVAGSSNRPYASAAKPTPNW